MPHHAARQQRGGADRLLPRRCDRPDTRRTIGHRPGPALAQPGIDRPWP